MCLRRQHVGFNYRYTKCLINFVYCAIFYVEKQLNWHDEFVWCDIFEGGEINWCWIWSWEISYIVHVLNIWWMFWLINNTLIVKSSYYMKVTELFQQMKGKPYEFEQYTISYKCYYDLRAQNRDWGICRVSLRSWMWASDYFVKQALRIGWTHSEPKKNLA